MDDARRVCGPDRFVSGIGGRDAGLTPLARSFLDFATTMVASLFSENHEDTAGNAASALEAPGLMITSTRRDLLMREGLRSFEKLVWPNRNKIP